MRNCMRGRKYLFSLTRYSYLLLQTEVPPPTSTSEEPSYLENDIEDSADEKEEKGDLYYDKDNCSMQEYEVMKVSFAVEYCAFWN